MTCPLKQQQLDIFEAKKSERAERQHQENNAYLKQLGGPRGPEDRDMLRAGIAWGNCPKLKVFLVAPSPKTSHLNHHTATNPMLFFSGWWRSTGSSSTR